MPTKDEHLRKAKEDEDFVASLKLTKHSHLPWAITALFYAGLHYVEAYFAAAYGFHSSDHRTRDSAIQRDAKLKKIYVNYNELKNYSINARYYMVRFKEQDFQDLTPRLDSIRRHIDALL